MSCRDPDPTPAPRGAHSYHSCLATPPFRPCRTGGPFSDTKTGPRTRIPGRLLLSLFLTVPPFQNANFRCSFAQDFRPPRTHQKGSSSLLALLARATVLDLPKSR